MSHQIARWQAVAIRVGVVDFVSYALNGDRLRLGRHEGTKERRYGSGSKRRNNQIYRICPLVLNERQVALLDAGPLERRSKNSGPTRSPCWKQIAPIRKKRMPLHGSAVGS